MIEEYRIRQIYSSNDYAKQAEELKEKIQRDMALLPKNVDSDEAKWDYRNFYSNVSVLFYVRIMDILEQCYVSSVFNRVDVDNTGWVIFPHITISLGDAHKYQGVDEYNEAVFTKYFDGFFGFNINDETVNKFFIEAKETFKESKYYACACSLLPIIEYFSRRLSGYSGNSKYTNAQAFEDILNRISRTATIKGTLIDTFANEYKKIIAFMQANYYKHSGQNDPEPDVLCRNRLLHGILTRQVSAADCLKLFNIVRSQSFLDGYFEMWDLFCKYGIQTLAIEDSIGSNDELDNEVISSADQIKIG